MTKASKINEEVRALVEEHGGIEGARSRLLAELCEATRRRELALFRIRGLTRAHCRAHCPELIEAAEQDALRIERCKLALKRLVDLAE